MRDFYDVLGVSKSASNDLEMHFSANYGTIAVL